MPLQELPPELLEHVIGYADSLGIARITRMCRSMHAIRAGAALRASQRLPNPVLQQQQEGDALDRLREAEVRALCEAPIVHEKYFGDLQLPPPTPSGSRYHDLYPHDTIAASKGVHAGGTLRKRGPLGGEDCFVEYRMVLENSGPTTEVTPSWGPNCFVLLSPVLEVVETYVPAHLRGNRLADALVEAAFSIDRWTRQPSPAHLSAGEGWRVLDLLVVRPTCTFVSQNFLPRHPHLNSRLDLYSTPLGMRLTARRRALSRRSSSELFGMCTGYLQHRPEEHPSRTWKKAALIEWLIEQDIGSL